ncbi:TetR/AcrR family transcriptional regulator [Streptomyces hoynatensis]|uniref:TetR/AcrR family transcriptional regulator n=1 Tax=Streptomyces hoynatensis TaxID=1141874 RepID=A0A3A9ZAL2_9ACTN|nr:TetR/AcrR family transcriptional regulator [Streptomyces hoynatensis]RKN45079.1 TetR/AcrR family transcriptional regulator [Streptomyces hoynatensis]
MTATKDAARPSARERLLAAADELFYAEGVQTVGIDRIIERAGVAKASLYNTFGGKEQLIRAYLEQRHARITARLTRRLAEVDSPRERLLTIFDVQGEQCARPGYHGCAFANATAEVPSGSLAEVAADEFRSWLRGLFTRLAGQLGVPEPERLARQLHLLYDGASQSSRMDRDPTSFAAAREAATTLLDAALAR